MVTHTVTSAIHDVDGRTVFPILGPHNDIEDFSRFFELEIVGPFRTETRDTADSQRSCRIRILGTIDLQPLAYELHVTSVRKFFRRDDGGS